MPVNRCLSSGFSLNMEISVIGSSQINLVRTNDVGFCSFSRNLNAKICNVKNFNSKACSLGQNQNLVWPSRSPIGLSLRASASESHAVVSEKASRVGGTEPVSHFIR